MSAQESLSRSAKWNEVKKKKNKGYLFNQNQELQMSSYLYHVLMPSFPNSRSQEYFIRTYILVYLES